MGKKSKAGTMKAKISADAKEILKENRAMEMISGDRGFGPCNLSPADQDAFLKYVKKTLPEATPKNVFENFTTQHMNFDYFITCYRVALMWAFNSFAEQKAVYATKRRALADMKTEDPQVRGLMLLMCAKMQIAEQKNLNEYIYLLASTLPFSKDKFDQNVFDFQNHKTYYMLMQEAKMAIDEGRFALVGEVKDQSHSLHGKDQGKPMERAFAMKIHKQLHETSINHMKALKEKKLPGPQLQQELNFLPVILGDILYKATGVEPHQLDCQTTQLGLESDEEYKALEKEYSAKIAEVRF